jgi:putative transposase
MPLGPVTPACKALGSSACGYFEHWRRKDTDKPNKPCSKKPISDEALLVRIRAIHAEVKQ